MLTAARRNEARCLPWTEIAPTGDLWLLPATRNKTARDFEVALSTPMVEILAKLPRLGDYVFTVNGSKPWTAHDKFKTALDRKSGVTGWVYHDLRRTVRSRLAELHIPYEIAERVLNHAMTRIERIYNRHAYRQEKAKALQAWADHLLFIVGEGREAPNVVTLRAGG